MKPPGTAQLFFRTCSPSSQRTSSSAPIDQLSHIPRATETLARSPAPGATVIRHSGGELSIEDIAKYAAGILGGGAIGAVVQALRKPSSKADIITVAQNAAHSMIADLRLEIDRLGKRIEKLTNDHEDCLKRNDELSGRLDELEGRLPVKRGASRQGD